MYQWYFFKRRWLHGNRIEINEIEKQIYIKQTVDFIKEDKFEIIPRDKNENFIYKYRLDRNKIKQMLLSLDKDDIKYKVKDIEYIKYGEEPLVVFKKQFHLVDKFGRDKDEIVYIKIKIKEGKLPIISFHLDE